MSNAILDAYNAVYQYMQNQGLQVYDILPGKNAPYPFYVVDDTQFIPSSIKNAAGGRVVITISGFADINQRGRLWSDLGKIEQLNSLENNALYVARHENNSIVVNEDDSVPNSSILHGVLILHFDYIQTI